MRKKPSSLVVIVRRYPVPVPVVVVPVVFDLAVEIVTEIFGTTAPAASFMVPSMVPVVYCPNTAPERQRTSSNSRFVKIKFLFIVCSFTKFLVLDLDDL